MFGKISGQIWQQWSCCSFVSHSAHEHHMYTFVHSWPHRLTGRHSNSTIHMNTALLVSSHSPFSWTEWGSGSVNVCVSIFIIYVCMFAMWILLAGFRHSDMSTDAFTRRSLNRNLASRQDRLCLAGAGCAEMTIPASKLLTYGQCFLLSHNSYFSTLVPPPKTPKHLPGSSHKHPLS